MHKSLEGYNKEYQRRILTLIEQVNKAYECFTEGKSFLLECEFDTMAFFRHATLFKAKLSPEFIMYLEQPSRGRSRRFSFGQIPLRFKTDELCEFYIFKKNAPPDRLPKHLAENRDYAIRAIKHQPGNRSHFRAFYKDVELVRLANVPGNEWVLYLTHSSINLDKGLIVELVKTNPECTNLLHKSLRKNNDFLWECYKANPKCEDYVFKYFGTSDEVEAFISKRQQQDLSIGIEPKKETEQQAKARFKRQSGM